MSEKLGQFLACLIVAVEQTGTDILKPEFRAMLEAYGRQHQDLVLGWPTPE